MSTSHDEEAEKSDDNNNPKLMPSEESDDNENSGILSADRPLEICAFLMATHPWERVNHPEEDYTQIPPPNHQNVHIYCGPGQGP